MNCPQCGFELADGAVFCPSCGSPVGGAQPQAPAYEQPAAPAQAYEPAAYAQPQADAYTQPAAAQPYAQPVPVQAPVEDKGSIGWGILGFLIPLVGLILFLVWRNKKPKSAKVAGMGAIIGFAFNMVVQIIGGM